MNIRIPTAAPFPEPDYSNLEFHELANVDRMMNEEEFETLKASIAKEGIWPTHRMILFEGKIISGRNRYHAAKAVVDYKLTAKDFTACPATTHQQAREWVWRESNRRHDTTADKQAKIIKAFADFPNYRDKQIALLVGVDRKTVKAARERMKPQDDRRLEKFGEDWEDLDVKHQRMFVEKFKSEIRDLL